MALPPGTYVGPYVITAQIGAGGMGDVYRATDTKLKRGVAIKVLPDALAHDPERLARFEREAIPGIDDDGRRHGQGGRTTDPRCSELASNGHVERRDEVGDRWERRPT